MMTTQEQDNIALVQRGFEAFAARDMQALSALFDADAVWNSAPLGVLKGDYRGRDQVFEYFGRLQQETGGTFRANPVAFAASGDRVFVFDQATGTRKGKTAEFQDILVFTLAAGKVTAIRLFSGDYPAAASFWS